LLEQYHWPGNVRELENVIQRAIVMAKGDVILTDGLPPEILARSPGCPELALPASPATAAPACGSLQIGELNWATLGQALFRWARKQGKMKILPTVERELIIQALLETKGNQVQAARLLGITRATLRKRVEKFGIKQELAIK
jgi:two-component system nitrogen regulation response regulator GlnG